MSIPPMMSILLTTVILGSCFGPSSVVGDVVGGEEEEEGAGCPGQPCSSFHCEDVTTCRGGTVSVMWTCLCCETCAKQEGEVCGAFPRGYPTGYWRGAGTCEIGLTCDLEGPEVRGPDEIREGVCRRPNYSRDNWNCASRPCEHGGRCRDIWDSRSGSGRQTPYCECPRGRYGHRCEYHHRISVLIEQGMVEFREHFCQNNHGCRNGATCIRRHYQYDTTHQSPNPMLVRNQYAQFCVCPPGWSGRYCDLPGRTHFDRIGGSGFVGIYEHQELPT